jgi:pre-mRNA-processing factor SLU7
VATNPVAAEDSDTDSDDDDEDRDEMKYAESADMAGSKVDTKRRITVRNLRMREDTAKYLLNLDPNSAHYDPKTRSMRANPLAHTGKEASGLPYAGDNFVRYSGDVSKVAERQLFAWEAADKGANIHLQADPTKAELMHKNFKVNKEQFKEQQRESLLDKYGGQEHLQAPPKELLLAQTEQYITYTKSGKPIGQERAKVLSRYEEDVHPGNHTSVWGSYWRDGRWGYACCHSFEKASYCTGAAGKAARAAKATDLLAAATAAYDKKEEVERPKSLVEQHREGRKDGKRSHSQADATAGGSGDDGRTREQRIADFMKKHRDDEQEASRMLAKDERDRGYNSAKRDFKEVSEEEMEAFRLARVHKEDPMAAYMGKD